MALRRRAAHFSNRLLTCFVFLLAQDYAQGFKSNRNPEYESRAQAQNGSSYTSGAQMATRRMKSADQLNGGKWDGSHDSGALLPGYAPERADGPNNSGEWRARSPQKDHHDPSQYEWAVPEGGEASQWIHRDKLAKIESQELQAAGLFVPRSRAPSKQKRDRSRSNMRRGTAESGQSRSRKNSAAFDQKTIEVPAWDLRTPEEVAEEAANAYFTSNGLKGGSRIPVAKTSPAPIALDYLERGSIATRNDSESPEEDPLASKSRSRSASVSHGVSAPQGRRSNTDISPKKPPITTTGRRGSMKQGRPKTRPGSSSGTRPSTRSGESPPTKQPEGDPPWMINSYKPDPRLPPEQQLLPTVAKRLQQEKWEKEGSSNTLGDTYDRDFRLLNDKGLLKPPSPKKQDPSDEEPNSQLPSSGEWPLRAEARSPSLRQGSYSTMPKITDKGNTSPLTPSRPTHSPLMFQPQIEIQSPAAQRVPEEKEDEATKKGGCGCCVVM